MGDFVVRHDALSVTDDGQKQMITAHVTVLRDGKTFAEMYPAKWIFRKHEESPTTEVAIHRGFAQDVYLVLATFDAATQTASLAVDINPLVNWVWMGFGLLALGIGIALLPDAAFAFATAPVPANAATTALILLAVVLSQGVALAQETVPAIFRSPLERRVANEIMCDCGGCRLSVELCGMMNCHGKERQLAKIQQYVKDGQDHDAILASFVREHGGYDVLMQPPNRGFNRVAWLLPYGVAVVCLLGVAFTARCAGRAAPALAGGRPRPRRSSPSSTHASSNELRDLDVSDARRVSSDAPVLAALRAGGPGRRHAGRVRLARPVAGRHHPAEPGRLRGGGGGRRGAADARCRSSAPGSGSTCRSSAGARAPRSSARRRWRCAPSRTSSSTTRWARCRTRTSPRWAARLRARAAGLLRQLDAGASYSAQIERELARRLEAAGAAPPAARARGPAGSARSAAPPTTPPRGSARSAGIVWCRRDPCDCARARLWRSCSARRARWPGRCPACAQDMPDPSLIHGKALAGAGAATRHRHRARRPRVDRQRHPQPVRHGVDRRRDAHRRHRRPRPRRVHGPAGGAGGARRGDRRTAKRWSSDPFTVPAAGGLRVILVAGIAKAAERKAAEAARAAAAPAVKGTVVFGGNSRVLMQFADDVLQVYYVLEIVNSARTRVDIGGPLVIDLPPGTERRDACSRAPRPRPPSPATASPSPARSRAGTTPVNIGLPAACRTARP